MSLPKKILRFIQVGMVAAVLILPAITSAAEEPAKAVAPAPAATEASTPKAGTTDSSYTFLPLTQLPGLQDIATSNSLSGFLNEFYKILIGIGAVAAVIMIMYAGVLIMTSSGSVRSNEKAKSYIQNALLGLLLILSPAIVFGIINPDILKLELNVSDLSSNFQAIKLEDLTEKEINSCEAFSKLYTVRSDDGSNKCSTGDALAPGQCCAGINSGFVCCGGVAAKQYLLAYTYVINITSGGKSAGSCRETKVAYFADTKSNTVDKGQTVISSGCDMTLKKTTTADVKLTDPRLSSEVKILKSCELVSNKNYAPPEEFKQTCK